MRIKVDSGNRLHAAEGHNRWHPDLEPIAKVSSGTHLTIETRDGFDAQIGRSSTDSDVDQLELGRSHPLTGPIAIADAEPGDLLEVEILGYELPEYGFTMIVPGVGMLADLYPGPRVIHWRIENGYARSDSLPGVSVPVHPFAGVVGVALSDSQLAGIRAREDKIARTGVLVAGADVEAAVPSWAGAGLRTIPPRENGGNIDVPQLVAGSKLLLEVQRPGALLSVGDLHAAQGEGECCGSALEVAGAVSMRVQLHRSPPFRPRFPVFLSPREPSGPVFGTTGIPLTDSGENSAIDLDLAARRALLEMIAYLVETLDVEARDAYALCSVAVDLRVSEAVNSPNSLVSALLPLELFDRAPWPFSTVS